MKEMIRVSNLSIAFGDTKALQNESFELYENEIFGFLGPSGAGKTTTIKALTGQLHADQGSIRIFDKDISELKDSLYEKIGILTDNSGLYEKLTVYENLKLFAEIHKVPVAKIQDVLVKLGLENEGKKAYQHLSRGMRQRVLFAYAILHEPKILFLDEPTSALDPATSEAVHGIIRDLQRLGTTIFLTTHNMEEADQLCDRVAFLNHGQIVEIGAPKDLKIKYAKNQVEIVTSDQQVFTCHKNGQEISAVLKQLKDTPIQSIHSLEPDLKTIFLDITGREL